MTAGAGDTDALLRGREAYGERRWLEAHDALSQADEASLLGTDDLELLAVASFMLGRDDDAVAHLERVHQLYVDEDDTLSAAHSAIWICLNLATRGEVGPATGWLGRAQRLLEREPAETALHGYLLLPLVFRHEAVGDFEQAAATAAEATRMAEKHGDRDLFALAVHAQGFMLIKDGRVSEGLALLDEGMVAVTSEELSPIVTGIVYCGVILACREVYEVRRAREWTLALTRWWEQQPQMVAFTGRCMVHRAEIMQLSGAWANALEAVRQAAQRFEQTRNRAAGLAHYREGELLRLQGDFSAAEAAYQEASRFGWEPQPGLAQLRLAQGARDAAVASIRRAKAETREPLKLAALLPAYVEIMLAAGGREEARAACAEFDAVVQRYESAMLKAMVAHAQGAVLLADGVRGVAGAGRSLRDRAHARAGGGGVPGDGRRGRGDARGAGGESDLRRARRGARSGSPRGAGRS